MAKKKKETKKPADADEPILVSEEKRFSFGICKASDIDEEQRTVIATISTGIVDRDNEVLDPKGVELENFAKNPVVPWSHDTWSPPIGKAQWVKKGRKRITAKVKFALTERAEEVWQLFKGGFLKAFSVGYMPKKGHRPEPDEIKANPDLAEARYIYDKWELLEFSPVTVPANPEALATAVKNKNISLSKEILQELEIEVEEVKTLDNDIENVDSGDDEEDICIPVTEIKAKKIEVEPIFCIDVIE